MQFLGKFGKIVCWPLPLESWRPLLGEILDPPLYAPYVRWNMGTHKNARPVLVPYNVNKPEAAGKTVLFWEVQGINTQVGVGSGWRNIGHFDHIEKLVAIFT